MCITAHQTADTYYPCKLTRTLAQTTPGKDEIMTMLKKLKPAKHKTPLGVGLATALFVMAAASGAQADPWVIDFDTDGAGNAVSHGQIVDNEYGTQIPGAVNGLGVTISAYAHHNGSTFSAPSVAFDTTQSNTEDSDLQENKSGRTGFNTNGAFPAASTGYGNILIIQEKDKADNYYEGDAPGPKWDGKKKYKSCNNDDCLSPDDNAQGGDLNFDFTQTVWLSGLNLFDIEETGGMIKFFDRVGNNFQLTSTISIPSVGGDTAGFLGFGENGAGVLADRMVVWLAGSGGIDNITGDIDGVTTDSVPEPGAMGLVLAGLLGFGAVRRRKAA
ncbi:MAG: hypothetical protein ACJAU6_001308 [Alphaproteobacteria bacterium]|jgi:hypothetical protein